MDLHSSVCISHEEVREFETKVSREKPSASFFKASDFKAFLKCF